MAPRQFRTIAGEEKGIIHTQQETGILDRYQSSLHVTVFHRRLVWLSEDNFNSFQCFVGYQSWSRICIRLQKHFQDDGSGMETLWRWRPDERRCFDAEGKQSCLEAPKISRIWSQGKNPVLPPAQTIPRQRRKLNLPLRT